MVESKTVTEAPKPEREASLPRSMTLEAELCVLLLPGARAVDVLALSTMLDGLLPSIEMVLHQHCTVEIKE